MVYKKRVYTRPHRKGRRPGQGSMHNYAVARGIPLAMKAFKMAKRLKDMVNTEYKYWDTTLTSTYNTTGNLSILNNPPQGISDTQRIGDSIKCQNLSLRGFIVHSPSAVSGLVRIMIIWDPQNKAAVVGDVLQYSGSVYGVISSKNYDKKFQTKVLHDKAYTLVTSSDSALKQFDIVIPINQHSQFENATQVVNSGALKILIISTETVNTPTVSFLARLSYTDN